MVIVEVVLIAEVCVTLNAGDVPIQPKAFVTVTEIGLLACVTVAVGVETPEDQEYESNVVDVVKIGSLPTQ
jgi:hypothetical protein